MHVAAVAVLLIAVFLILAGSVLILAAYQMHRIHKRRRIVLNARPPDPCGYAVDWQARAGGIIAFAVNGSGEVVWEVRPLACRAEASEQGKTMASGRCRPGLQSSRFNPWEGCRWPISCHVDTTGWPSDVYVMEVVSAEDPKRRFCIPFVLGPDKACDVIVVASTNTWAAYNSFGGWSNYTVQALPRVLGALDRLFNGLNFSIALGTQDRFPQVPLSYPSM
jgi:hypothetical protein